MAGGVVSLIHPPRPWPCLWEVMWATHLNTRQNSSPRALPPLPLPTPMSNDAHRGLPGHLRAELIVSNRFGWVRGGIRWGLSTYQAWALCSKGCVWAARRARSGLSRAFSSSEFISPTTRWIDPPARAAKGAPRPLFPAAPLFPAMRSVQVM